MQIDSLNSTILFSDDLQDSIAKILAKHDVDNVFVLTDKNTKELCFPLLAGFKELKNAKHIQIGMGEGVKTIESVVLVWEALYRYGADRKTLLLNLGGGMLCDVGGFAAATYKRGISFVHIPTTLLAQVDASIGGKLGFNFQGLKNHIGLFKVPDFVIINPIFLKTLDTENLYSGFAEIIKHALIYSEEHWKKTKKFKVEQPDFTLLKQLITKSVFIKNDYVKADPQEKSKRKALNFGHTFGHAFESFLLKKKHAIPHGNAVAQGIIAELFLSHKLLGFSKESMFDVVAYLRANYPKPNLKPEDFEALYRFMKHDKKNENNEINFTLLSQLGQVEVNQVCGKDEMREAYDYFLAFSTEID